LAQAGISVKLTGQIDHAHTFTNLSLEDLQAPIAAKDHLLASGYRPELQPGVVVEGELAGERDNRQGR
jgi:hypothetical protein